MHAREKPAKTGVRTREREREKLFVCISVRTVHILSKLGCRSLPIPSTGKAFRRGELATKKFFLVVSRETLKIGLGPTMADMWAHRKFVSARIPVFFLLLLYLTTHRKSESRYFDS